MAQGNQVKVSDRTEVSVVGEIVSAEITNQIATAKKHPRDAVAALAQLEKLACRSDAVAESCMYSLKRKDKDGSVNFITGPSVRFAELLAHCWGNLRAGARIVEEGERAVVAQGVAYDLQANTGFSVEVRRGILTSTGKRFGADMVNVTSNAACSIALRNAIFDCVPQVLWQDAYEVVKARAIGAAQIPEKLQNAVKFFVGKGAKVEDILAAMGVEKIEEMGREHLEIFIGLRTALKEGGITADKIFTPEGKEQRDRLSLVDDGEVDPSGDQYNSIDKQLLPKGKAAEAPAQVAAPADKPPTEKKDGAEPKPDAATGDQSRDGGDKAKTATPAEPAGSQSEAEETDDQLVARIEAEVKAAPNGEKSKPIKAAMGALQEVAEKGEDEALRKRADKLLNMFEID